jgi:hypothetical protein
MSLKHELSLERIVLAQLQNQITTIPGAPVGPTPAAQQGLDASQVPYGDVVDRVTKLISSINSLTQRIQTLEQKSNQSGAGQANPEPPTINGYQAPNTNPGAPMIANATGQTAQAQPDGSFSIQTP